MKKLLLMALYVFTLSFSGYAQKVMGIDIKVKMSEFKPLIIAKGGKLAKSVEGTYEYYVTFAGYQNCRMKVQYNTGNDSIRFVTIYFPHESYENDRETYNEICRQYKEKYGLLNISKYDDCEISIFRTSLDATNVNWYWGKEKYVCVFYRTGAEYEENKAYSPDI